MQAAPSPLEAANDGVGSSERVDRFPESSLTQWIGVLLQRAAQDTQLAFEKALSVLDIDSRQYSIACLIREFGPQSQVALCDMLQVDRASMVKFVDRLESSGWVTREPHPGDRRQNAVTLTAKGRKGLKSADSMARSTESQCLQALSTDQRETLRQLLRTALGWRPPAV